jgi:hypothetical protein
MSTDGIDPEGHDEPGVPAPGTESCTKTGQRTQPLCTESDG